MARHGGSAPFGNVTAFSFYVTKNVTTIEGGALVTDDRGDRRRRSSGSRCTASASARGSASPTPASATTRSCDPGYKYNMTDVQAALGLHQLPRLDRWIDRRAELWERYDRAARGLAARDAAAARAGHPSRPPPLSGAARPRGGVRVATSCSTGSPARKIGTGVHYRGVHLHPFYRDKYGLTPSDFPVASAISERTLSLPLSPKVTEADQDDVVRGAARAAQRG